MGSSTTVRGRLGSPFSLEELATFEFLLAHQGQAILESCQGLSASESGLLRAELDLSADYLWRAQAELKEISEAFARIDDHRYGRC